MTSNLLHKHSAIAAEMPYSFAFVYKLPLVSFFYPCFFKIASKMLPILNSGRANSAMGVSSSSELELASGSADRASASSANIFG